MSVAEVNRYRVPMYRLLAAMIDPDETAGAQYALHTLNEAEQNGTLKGLALELARFLARSRIRDYKRDGASREDCWWDTLTMVGVRLDDAEREQREQPEGACR